MATENLMMAATRRGGDRQDLHERIRTHSIAAAGRIKAGDGLNDLMERLAADPAFAGVDLGAVLEPGQFVGRAPEQVDAFLRDHVEPIRARHPAALGQRRDVHV